MITLIILLIFFYAVGVFQARLINNFGNEKSSPEEIEDEKIIALFCTILWPIFTTIIAIIMYFDLKKRRKQNKKI